MAKAYPNYSEYFDIDSDYFPQVNKEIIDKTPDLWQKYYPHDSFVKLLEAAIRVLSRSDKRALWVEGAYGTGKSHAVLTLKKLIDAEDDAVRAYFERHRDLLNADLYQKFVSMRPQGGKILTVHRYGSSEILSDDDLNLAIYQSLLGVIESRPDLRNPQASFRDGVLKWLEEPDRRIYMNALLKKYRDKVQLNGADVDAVERMLRSYQGAELESVLQALMKIGHAEDMKIFKLDREQLLDWIRDLIRENNIRILFVWDEFSEFFKNNMRSLTGFQRFADFSGEQPFYILIVTHHVQNLFSSDRDARKIFDRFSKISIELPPHMGFKLIGKALQKDRAHEVEWTRLREDQRMNTKLSRKAVMEYARVNDEDLKNILPIHPYTAVVLKEIASAFQSNQRSMFDFIKNDSDPNTQGFKWFIQSHGPMDDTPLFMIDMLWNFFYERNRMALEGSIRNILDGYTKVRLEDENEERVLKTVLILQAIANQLGASTKNMKETNAIFIPTLDNIRMAFESDDSLTPDKAQSTLESLVRRQIVYKQTTNRTDVYNVMMMSMNNDELDKLKREHLDKFKTDQILPEERDFALQSNGLHRRYRVSYLSETLFGTGFKKLNTQIATDNPEIPLAVAMSRDDEEYQKIYHKICDAYQADNGVNAVVALSGESFGADRLNDYIEKVVNRDHQKGKDNKQAEAFDLQKNSIKTKWYDDIKNRGFIVFSREYPNGIRTETYAQMQQTVLREILRKRYPCALELSFTVTDALWNDNQLKMGAECGIKRELRQQYKSTKTEYKLDEQLKNIWTDTGYWQHHQINDQCTTVAEMKKSVDKFIQSKFERDGRVSFREIYALLQKTPYGLFKCNMTSFVMGFVLREYACENYAWSDGMVSDDLDWGKLAQSIDSCVKGIGRNRDEYITKNDEEKRKFAEATQHIWDISQQECRQYEDARKNLRQKMTKLSFPIWTLTADFKADYSDSQKAELTRYIDCYSRFVNNDNSETTDKELTGEIARMYKRDQSNAHLLRDLLKRDALKLAMAAYVASVCPELPEVARRLGDDAKKYLDRIKSKVSSEGNWLWNDDTVNVQIRSTLAEYRVSEASLAYIEQTVVYEDTLRRWSDKLQSLKISYKSLREANLDNPKELLELLNKLIDQKHLDADPFVQMLESEGDKLKDFLSPERQQLLFAELNHLENEDLSDVEIRKIYADCPNEQWTKASDMYLNDIHNRVIDYKNNTLAGKLAELWKEKTQTESPKAWSKLYQMPIQAMLDEKDQDEAIRCFETINSRSVSPAEVREATTFVNRIDWRCLAEASYRDAVFRRVYLSKYADLLTDIKEVQQTLIQHINDPYQWFNNTRIEGKIEALAQKKYAESGHQLAMDKIDNLDAESLKAYLKDLIKTNYKVGIEIIRSKS